MNTTASLSVHSKKAEFKTSRIIIITRGGANETMQRITSYLHLATISALFNQADALPKKYNGLAQIYYEHYLTLLAANTTVADPHELSRCERLEMPEIPDECAAKSGTLVCDGQLLCEYPTGWGLGYDVVGECWDCEDEE
ncbi:hypothetical protein F4779DRAFT_619690 [Xylariaceae sp. FL0662B]|nr:hypothetical protein F4779DRAFT_619690 [Xylariaceae sp. FL0662B]